MKFVWANADKPRNCPCCHAVDWEMRWRFGRCGKCGLWWWAYWSTLRAYTVVCPVHGDLGARLEAEGKRRWPPG